MRAVHRKERWSLAVLAGNEPAWSQLLRHPGNSIGSDLRSQPRHHLHRARGRGGLRYFGRFVCGRATHRSGAVWDPCRAWAGRGLCAVGRLSRLFLCALHRSRVAPLPATPGAGETRRQAYEEKGG